MIDGNVVRSFARSTCSQIGVYLQFSWIKDSKMNRLILSPTT